MHLQSKQIAEIYRACWGSC